MLNMAEFDQIKDNFDAYLDAFIRMYQEYGGPPISKESVELMTIITALQNCMIMIAAIPNSLKMCPPKEWSTIKDRHDPRIAGNIDNKSTLRSMVHVLDVTFRVL